MNEINDVKFTVEVKCGDVFINGEFVSQLCWTNESIGYAVTDYLDNMCNNDNQK